MPVKTTIHLANVCFAKIVWLLAFERSYEMRKRFACLLIACICARLVQAQLVLAEAEAHTMSPDTSQPDDGEKAH